MDTLTGWMHPFECSLNTFKGRDKSSSLIILKASFDKRAALSGLATTEIKYILK